MIQVKITSNELGKALAASGHSPGAIGKVLDVFTGGNKSSLVRRSIFEKIGVMVARDAKVNAKKKGGRFWGDIGDTISHEATDQQVTVGSTHFAARMKQFGGVIRAPGKGKGSTNAQALTIPTRELREQLKGQAATVREVKTRFTIFRVKDILFAYRTGDKNAPTFPAFILKKQVRQKPDPWFPTDAQVTKQIDFIVGKIT